MRHYLNVVTHSSNIIYVVSQGSAEPSEKPLHSLSLNLYIYLCQLTRELTPARR
jgi:hypothetical protein